jgi:2-desacetyl-2-hydroxyethyl bacteriochlorophyllide A dehydrogenase
MMQARYACIPAPLQVQLRDEEIDPSRLGPHEVVLEAECSLIGAGVELAIFAGRTPGLNQSGLGFKYPWRPGYALVGRVVARGSDRIAVRDGERVLALGRHASHQIYDANMHRPAAIALPLREGTAARLLVAARFLRVALMALRAVAARSCDVAIVVGLGVIGNLTAQVLRRAGARVIAVTTSELRGRVARAVGLETICAPRRDQAPLVREMLGGEGASLAFDAVGSVEVATLCASLCRRSGRVVLLGTARAPEAGGLDDFLGLVYQRGLEVMGVYEWGERLPVVALRQLGPSVWWDYVHAVQLIEDGSIAVAPLLTHRIDPAQIPDMYRVLHASQANHLGVVVDWQ